MLIEKDAAIPMRDGAILRANIFLPRSEGTFPVLMTFGPYGKDVHLSQFMPPAWERIQQRHPEILQASSCKHLVFETPDPEVWVPHGYVVLKVDSRGAGKSPGKLDINSPAEFCDFYDAIEWVGVQPWSSGKIGLLGISYYAAGRVSQRKLDAERSTPWRPRHTHDETQKLKPGEICEIDLEIWPTSIFLPRGYRLALTLQGKDFERVGWFTHDDPRDRPPASFAGVNTIHTGADRQSYVLLPVISSER